MRSSKLVFLVALAVAQSRAEQPTYGFLADRLSPSPVGADFIANDSLLISDKLSFGARISVEYTRGLLVVDNLRVVSDFFSADIGGSVNFRRARLSLDFRMPFAGLGNAGTARGQQWESPGFDPSSHPGMLSDTRVGFEYLFYGDVGSPLRVGASAQLFIPAGQREHFITDGTYRGTLRALVAGDFQRLTYAAHLGVHIRPLAVSGPGPQGPEILSGVGLGVWLRRSGKPTVLLLGELYGVTSFIGAFGADTSSLEALLSLHVKVPVGPRQDISFALVGGAGAVRGFGAPEGRVLFTATFTGK